MNKESQTIYEEGKRATRGQKFDDSGKYRIQFNGYKSPGSYAEDRAAAQGLVRIMNWFVKDNGPLTDAIHGELLLCNPGEPDVTVAIYVMYTSGRIMRKTTATGHRTTVCWGSEQ